MTAAVSRASLLGLVVLVLGVAGASQWWAGLHERRLGAEVAERARPGDIVMIASETCAICATARSWMREHRVAFSECVIERDAQCRERFDALRAPGTPVILVRGKPQLGFNRERLLQGLRAST